MQVFNTELDRRGGKLIALLDMLAEADLKAERA